MMGVMTMATKNNGVKKSAKEICQPQQPMRTGNMPMKVKDMPMRQK